MDRYASDCFIIQSYLLGDPTGIEDVIKADTRSKAKPVSEGNSNTLSLIELRVTLQTVMARVAELEKNEVIH